MTTLSQGQGYDSQTADRDASRVHEAGEEGEAGGIQEDRDRDTTGTAESTEEQSKGTSQVEPFPGAWRGSTGGDDAQARGTTCSGCMEDYQGVPGTKTWTGGKEERGETEGGETEGGDASGKADESRGAGAAKGIKGFASTVHGAGEAFRGSLMQGVDQVFGHEEGVEKHQKIAQAGMEKMRSGRGEQGTGTGATG